MRGLLSAAVLLGAYGGFRKEEVIGLGTDKIRFNKKGEMTASKEASKDIVAYPKFVSDLIMQRANHHPA